jgi:hypothetical protein
MSLSAASFPELADAVFVATQVMAIRIDTMGSLLGEGIGRGHLERRIEDAERHGRHLASLFSTLYGLAPREDEARNAIDALLAGDDVAAGGPPRIRFASDAAPGSVVGFRPGPSPPG